MYGILYLYKESTKLSKMRSNGSGRLMHRSVAVVVIHREGTEVADVPVARRSLRCSTALSHGLLAAAENDLNTRAIESSRHNTYYLVNVDFWRIATETANDCHCK